MPLKILAVIFVFGAPLLPTFWAIFDIPKRQFATPKKRLFWLFFVATLPFVGAVFYIIFARRHTEPLQTS